MQSIILNRQYKPKCKLPNMLIVSSLVGITVSALREAGKIDEMREFVNLVKTENAILDYYRVLDMASRYVDFYD